jgi:AAA15 family ATPase/GTPase
MKILKLTANGFKLCEDNFTINFVPSANKPKVDKEFELKEIDKDLFVYNTIGIIGKNASGKTTAVELLAVVYDLISNFRIKDTLKLFKFIENKIKLDITFYHDKKIYRYLVNLVKDENSVNDNILFKNEKLFSKDYKPYQVKDIFEFDQFTEEKIEKILPEDTSILYFVLKEIKYRGIYFSSFASEYSDFESTFDLYKAFSKTKNIVPNILKILDDHIKNIEMIGENKYKITYINNDTKTYTNAELNVMLSSGTVKGLGLFSFVIYSLISGADLIIDEIENHFHKTLVANLINLYKDKTVNKKKATLIFTTHYCELLDLFNRSDNIYISKHDKKIRLENMHEHYNVRSILSKSNKFYNNEFGTNVNYDALMELKRELMK